ncbi:UNVERIFIED_CONTAM: hypothetical protein GTU68_056492 [Idotea baltica]|nr:hypothetical protein [Idotea baltica]
MTQASQVAELVELSIDAIGVILHAESPRLITIDQAIEIRQQIPAFISMVGVFVDCEVGLVNTYSKDIGLDLVQLHGAETSDYAAQLNVPYINAIRAKSAEQVVTDIQQHPAARAMLLDPYVKGQHGGTGQQIDASVWPKEYAAQNKSQKLILAGGLSVENILSGVQNFSPYAVDLNSGVEISPGQKNIKLVADCLRLLGR